jgi:hypothetical protein
MDTPALTLESTERAPGVFHAAHGWASHVQISPGVRNGNGAGGGVGGVVALFVASDSIYKALDCDCYDAERNALTYAGNAPVVAHPPCQLWGKMAKVNHVRWGGVHNRPGNDGGCFRFALDAVNRCGGVLEHPAETYAWKAHGLPYPPGFGWTRWKQGWVCEVWQSAYGHRAQKRTWLYYCGVNPPEALRWDRPKGTHQVGHEDRGRRVNTNKPTLGKREANATPPEFARALISLAGRAAGAGVGRRKRAGTDKPSA